MVGYDKQGNILSYRMGPVSIAKVIEDRGDHFDITIEEIELFKEILCQLEHLSKEEYHDFPKVMPSI